MVYLFLAEGFEEVEALTPVDLLRRAGIGVTTVAVGDSTAVAGAHGITVTADMTGAEALASGDDMEMMVLPGGMPGTRNLDASVTVSSFLTKANSKGAFIAAICAAPSVPGKRGMLRGKKAVCYPGFEDKLAGAVVCDCGVVRDGKYICGRAAGSAVEFALELIKALKGESAAEEVRRQIIA